MSNAMKETEKAIIATAVEFQSTRFFFFENCDKDFFASVHAQAIYNTMRELRAENREIDWMTLIDLCEIPVEYFSDLPKTLIGVHNPGLFIKDKIALIKRTRAKRQILQQINDEIRSANPDFEKMIETLSEAKVIELKEEKSDFQTAYNEYLQRRKGERINVRLGLPKIDRWIGGFMAGEILSILARTAVGKSWLALMILEQAFRMGSEANFNPSEVGFFSYEMPKAAIVERMLQLQFGLWREDLDRQLEHLDTDEFLRQYEKLRIYNRSYTVGEVERIADRDGLKIIFIDFLQLVKDENVKASPYERTSTKMRDLKQFAMEKGTVIILTVQLSRKAGGGGEPVTIDAARESGQIEELSDFIIGAWNPALNPRLTDQEKILRSGTLKVELLKNKRGPQVSLEANFSPKSGKITEMTEREE